MSLRGQDMKAQEAIAIVGGGVIGLTAAAEAVRRGHSVTLFSDRLLDETTSWKAAASFKPYGVPYTPEVNDLVEHSWVGMERYLSDYGPATGIRMHVHWEASDQPLATPPYLHVVKNAICCEAPVIPGGYSFAWKYETFFIDMPVFLPWLRTHLLEKGVIFKSRHFNTLDEVLTLPQSVIMLAGGYAAKKLTGDVELTPQKGQAVLLDLPMPMEWSISADGFYVYPRTHDTLLGGTNEPGVEDEEPDQETAVSLIAGNHRILSGSHALVKAAIAGIRPYRKSGPRIESQLAAGKLLVHNYGHGGAGVTLSTGSAKAAMRAIDGQPS